MLMVKLIRHFCCLTHRTREIARDRPAVTPAALPAHVKSHMEIFLGK